jgi:hypothetical protein
MPIKYFEVKKFLRSKISLIDSITNKFFKYVLLYGMLVLLFLVVNGELDENNIIVLLFLILLGVFYRLIILFERTDIKNLAIYIKESQLLDDDSKKLLIGDIESSLKKIANFANWSCGVLATISIFVSTTYITLLKDIITREKLLELLWIGNENSIENSFIGQIILLIILVLLGYYLSIQAFTYDKRFVIMVLKSSLYINEDDIIIEGFWKKLMLNIKYLGL